MFKENMFDEIQPPFSFPGLPLSSRHLQYGNVRNTVSDRKQNGDLGMKLNHQVDNIEVDSNKYWIYDYTTLRW